MTHDRHVCERERSFEQRDLTTAAEIARPHHERAIGENDGAVGAERARRRARRWLGFDDLDAARAQTRDKDTELFECAFDDRVGFAV